jgi:hypothetical protein
VKGKWAQGITPRHFTWVIKDRLAICERPGGYGENHRRVRRQEEIIWIREQGFSRVISLLPSPHNLQAYEDAGVKCTHIPFAPSDDAPELLARVYGELDGLIEAGEKLVVHQDELGDRLMGVMAGYLVYTGMVPEGPKAITLVERIVQRQIGPAGRSLVTVAAGLRA